MYRIGYRIKLPTDFSNQELFLTRYSTLFNTFELKIKDDILYASCIENIIKIAQSLNINSYSFHIFKDSLYNMDSYLKTRFFLEQLDKFNLNPNVNIVTHYISEKMLDMDFIKNLLKYKNFVFCLENIEVEIQLFEYLEKLKSLAQKLNCYVCLDIGHLFFSAKKCDIEPMAIISYILADNWWKNNIKEIHLHDFNSEKCHLNIGNGELNLCNIKSIIFPNIPIIVETTINDLSKDGIQELGDINERVI